jgi:hypothetical protein
VAENLKEEKPSKEKSFDGLITNLETIFLQICRSHAGVNLT